RGRGGDQGGEPVGEVETSWPKWGMWGPKWKRWKRWKKWGMRGMRGPKWKVGRPRWGCGRWGDRGGDAETGLAGHGETWESYSRRIWASPQGPARIRVSTLRCAGVSPH